MNRVLAVGGQRLVTVEAGITLHVLGEELAARGLAMENQGDIDAQTLAGAISTATHGTGARFGNLSSQVVGMRLVTAPASRWSVREGDELARARVGLGALGVISQVTLRCVPAFTIHRVDEPRSLDDVLPASTSWSTPRTTSRSSSSPTRDVALTLHLRAHRPRAPARGRGRRPRAGR